MYVKCTHCGYDNSPEYRFCGMCGASLAKPQAAQPASLKEPSSTAASGNGQTENVHGPSFLGLSQDPKVEFHYLYEDEQPRSHVGLIIFVLIMLGAGGYLAYQWKNNGFPFNHLNAASSSGSGGAQASASPSEVAPASNSDQSTHLDKPMTGAGDVLPTQPDQNAQTQTPGKPTETDIPPAQGQAQSQNAPAIQNSPPQQSANANATPAQPQTSAAQPKAENTQEADATPPTGVAAASKATRESPAPRTAKPAPSRAAQPAAAATSPDADLEVSGERYLYGNGVPQNCARAEVSLRTAAMHGNSKAETVLGTMYATGHCVGRDLPTAYRWFARALHQEPQNGRISEDLQVLWRQMTPQEKQLAMASGQ